MFFVFSEPASTFEAPILQSIFSCPIPFPNIVHAVLWEAYFLYYVSDCDSSILQYYIMHFVDVFWSCDSSWRATTMFIFTGRSSTFKRTKPSFDYAVRHSRFPQSCRHIFMNLRKRHSLLLKVFNNSSLLNCLHSVLTLHPMSFKHLLRSNTNIHRLATLHIAIAHIKDI